MFGRDMFYDAVMVSPRKFPNIKVYLILSYIHTQKFKYDFMQQKRRCSKLLEIRCQIKKIIINILKSSANLFIHEGFLI